MREALLAMALLMGSLTFVEAHEFWIEPQAFVLPEDGQLSPVVRIGENLDGEIHPFQPRAYERVVWSGPDAARDLSARPLSAGAARLTALGTGVHILALQSFSRSYTHPSEAAFLDYVKSIRLEGRINTAQASLSPDGTVTERYRRLAKTLVHFGEQTGSDRRIGLDREWVRDATGVRLCSGARSVADHPAYLYCRQEAGTPVTVAELVTDPQGAVRPELPDGAQCLLNSVFLNRQADGSWSSDWVSIYFTP